MIRLYTFIMSLLIAAGYPLSLILALFGKNYMRDRFLPPSGLPENGSRRVWIHAASVGESGIAFSLATEIRKCYPESIVFVSTITATGLERIRAMNRASDAPPVAASFLAPFDHPIITKRFLRTVAPTSFILVETELWPWLVLSMKKRDVPVTVVNGKISKRAFRRYMVIRRMMAPIVECLSLVCVQNRSFAKRFHLLGVPRNSIEIVGNVKFDGLPVASDYDREKIRADLGIDAGLKIFVAGSTRPGEEEVLVAAFGIILEAHSDTVLVLAPRHLNRLAEVVRILDHNGVSYTKRSDADSRPEAGGVLLLDTMGELIQAYAAADAAFVGGSLSDFGGHNPLEPAALGVPVVFGHYMEQTGSKELLNDGAAILVHDRDELAGAVIGIFDMEKKIETMKEAGPIVVGRFKGTLARTIRMMGERSFL